MMGEQLTISVVVPVYNSSEILPVLVERLKPVLEEHYSAYELILVNDASRDQSWQVIEQLSDQYAWITGIDLMRNYGQHNALLAGIRAARNEIVVTMDDDLQHPPEEIPHLVEKLNEGHDVVYGIPHEEQHGLWRNLASQSIKLAMKLAMRIETAPQVSAFRAFRLEVREAFINYASPYIIIDVLLSWGTTRFAAVEVRHAPRYSGESNYTFSKLVQHTFNMLTGFSIIPLQLASYAGFAFTLFGLGVLVYVVGRYLVNGVAVQGFTFTASIIAIFSGTQLFALGIIGEYLARMHLRIMERPSYVVRKIRNAGKIERTADASLPGHQNPNEKESRDEA